MSKPDTDNFNDYSMNFDGADLIAVTRTQYDKEGSPNDTKAIEKSEEVAKVVQLLKELPKVGQLMIKMGPCTEHQVMAVKDNEPFAQVEFYGASLKTEDTSFYAFEDGDENEAKEKELYNLIKID